MTRSARKATPKAIARPVFSLGPPPRHFLRECREAAGHPVLRTFAELLERKFGWRGLTYSNLSKIETGELEYNQHVLEAYAEAFGCLPAELLVGPPFGRLGGDRDVGYDILDSLPPERKTQALAILKTFGDN
jgi:hypothetical protein